MKRECFDSLPKNKAMKNQAYELCMKQSRKLFEQVKAQYTKRKAEELMESLQKAAEVRRIKKGDKRPIFEYFLNRELETLESIKEITTINVKIIRITKCRVEGRKTDWLQLWHKIVSQCPEISHKSKNITSLVHIVKNTFDENNAIDVWSFFFERGVSLNKAVTRSFINITPKTDIKIFNQCLQRLVLKYRMNQLDGINFLQYFDKAVKSKKYIDVNQDVYQTINECIIDRFTSLTFPRSSDVHLKLEISAGLLLEKFIGKCNPGSIDLINTLMRVVKKMINPLEECQQAIGFLYYFIKTVSIRVEKQRALHRRLAKLKNKVSNKKSVEQPKQAEGEQKQAEGEQKQAEGEQKQAEGEQKQAEGEQKQAEGEQKQAEGEDKPTSQKQGQEEEAKEQDDEDDDDEDSKDEADDQTALIAIINSEQEQEDEEQEAKEEDNDEEKTLNTQRLLQNEITQKILDCIRKHLSEIFTNLYYVHSKKTVPHLLKYIYRLFPDFTLRSLEVLEMAKHNPHTNIESLVKNILVGIEYMFDQSTCQESIKTVMDILDKVSNCRRIFEVWPIYQCITGRIPLMDETDMKLVPDSQKQAFEEKLGLKHDRFYEEYSDHVLEVFRRLLREDECLDSKDSSKISKKLRQLYENTYVGMRARFMSLVLEAFHERPSGLSIKYLSIAKLTARQQEVIQNQYNSLNDESESTKSMRKHLLFLFMKEASLQELKPKIRQLAKEGDYELAQLICTKRLSEKIDWQPLPSSLRHLWEHFKVRIKLERKPEDVVESMKQLQQFLVGLMQDIETEMEGLKNSEDFEGLGMIDRVVATYKNAERIVSHKERRKINELLNIIKQIDFVERMVLKMDDKVITFMETGVQASGIFVCYLQKRKGFLKQLLGYQEILNDPNIMGLLNSIIPAEFFYCSNRIRYLKKMLKSEKQYSKNHESPGNVCRMSHGNSFLSQTRAYMSALDQARQGGYPNVKQIAEELFLMLASSVSDRVTDILLMFMHGDQEQMLKHYTLELISKSFENRFLLDRIKILLDFLGTNEVTFEDQQIKTVIDYHAKHMQSQDRKIREYAYKSFHKAIKIVRKHPHSEQLDKTMEHCLQSEKMEMIWLLYVLMVIGKPDLAPQQAAPIFHRYIIRLEPLILNDSRFIRRMSLYLHSIMARKLKKFNTQHKLVKFESSIPKKSLQEFVETGFLRPEFYEVKLKDRAQHEFCPTFSTYKVKTCSGLKEDYYSFLIEDPAKAQKFIKDFHSDLVDSFEMLISARQSAMLSEDLFTLATKELSSQLLYIKTRDMSVSKLENLTGAKFFKYLFLQDARNGFKFFKTTNKYVLDLLDNQESLDNQTLVLIYTHTLLHAYNLQCSESHLQVQQFIINVFRDVLEKGSSGIFNKFSSMLFDKQHDLKRMGYITQVLEKMIEERSRVSRASEILLKIHNSSYRRSCQIMKLMLKNRLDLDRPFFSEKLLTLILDPNSRLWSVQHIRNTQIIDLDQCLQAGHLLKVGEQFVMHNNTELHEFLLQEIEEMVNSDQISLIKSAFNLIGEILQNTQGSIFRHAQQSVPQGCIVPQELYRRLVELSISIINDKKELRLDYDDFIENKLVHVFGSIARDQAVFEQYLMTVILNVETTKRGISLLKILALFHPSLTCLSEEVLLKWVEKVLQFKTKSALYQDMLTVLTSMLTYKHVPFSLLESKIIKENTEDRIILAKAYLLAENRQIDDKLVTEVASKDQKDRRKIWAKDMMAARGKREKFEDEGTQHTWKQIKEISNPYNYIT